MNRVLPLEDLRGPSAGQPWPMQRDHILGLDHLRAVAALMVFYWHGLRSLGVQPSALPDFPPLSLFEEGYIGVSFFIVITGFIFTVLTYGKEISYFRFLKNRFLRLFPLLFLVQLYAVQDLGGRQDSVFFFFNLLGGGAPYVSWTLVVEFQFYIAFPFLLGSLINDSWRSTLLRCGGMILLFVFFRATFYLHHGEVQSLTYWTMFGRADEFAAGMIAGLAYLKLRNDFRIQTARGCAILLATATVTLIGLQHWFNVEGGFHGQPAYPSPNPIWIVWQTINAVIWAAIVFSYCMITRNATGRLSKCMAYVGTISYSFYMLHLLALDLAGKILNFFPTYQFFDAYLPKSFAVVTIFLLPPTLLLAALSYELIESPFLKRRVKYLTDKTQA